MAGLDGGDGASYFVLDLGLGGDVRARLADVEAVGCLEPPDSPRRAANGTVKTAGDRTLLISVGPLAIAPWAGLRLSATIAPVPLTCSSLSSSTLTQLPGTLVALQKRQCTLPFLPPLTEAGSPAVARRCWSRVASSLAAARSRAPTPAASSCATRALSARPCWHQRQICRQHSLSHCTYWSAVLGLVPLVGGPARAIDALKSELAIALVLSGPARLTRPLEKSDKSTNAVTNLLVAVPLPRALVPAAGIHDAAVAALAPLGGVGLGMLVTRRAAAGSAVHRRRRQALAALDLPAVNAGEASIVPVVAVSLECLARGAAERCRLAPLLFVVGAPALCTDLSLSAQSCTEELPRYSRSGSAARRRS